MSFFSHPLHEFIFPILRKLMRKEEVSVVAVSGGVDSMALLHLLFDYKESGASIGSIIPAIVDHGLRPNSSEEAQMVCAWCETLGFEPVLLKWEGKKPQAAVQRRARDARYELLFEACASRDAKNLLTAHHFDDQLETFFLRLFKGSGVQGLSCMRQRSPISFGFLLRPLLSCHKRDLFRYMQDKNHPFVEDPSNQNMNFERVRLRSLIEFLRKEKFNADAIAMTVKHCQELGDDLQEEINSAYEKLFQNLSLNVEDFCLLSFLKRRELLRRILWELSKKPYPPKFDRVEHIDSLILKRQLFTVSGYYWRYQDGKYVLSQENRSPLNKE